MIYNKLRLLPKVIQMEIYETGDLTLLSDEDTPLEELLILWTNLEEEFNQKYNKTSTDQLFSIEKEIEYQQNRYTIINSCCEQLLFDKTPEIIDLLKNEGYKFDENSIEYKNQIDKIHRESKGILIKIKQLQDKLPKPTTVSEINKVSIIDVMASYSAVLGVAFDFNTCSIEGFHSYEKQVKAKIKSIESQNTKQS